MSNQADIRDIQILGDLKTAFGRFGEDVSKVLVSLKKQFEEIQERLQEHQTHWQRQADQAQEEVYAARRSLGACEIQDDDEDGNSPDCSYEEEQVSDAEKLLTECEKNLETVEQWRHRIESQIVDFQNDMHRLSNLASTRTSSAQAFLANKIEILNRYVGGSSGKSNNINISQKADKPPFTIEAQAPQLREQNKDDTLQIEGHSPIKVSSGSEIHHIATDKNRISIADGGPYTPRFEGLFEKAGMNLQDSINKLPILGHHGPHPKYNRIVYERLSSAVEGLNGFAYEDAFQNELYAIAQDSAKSGSELNRLLIKKENNTN